MTEPDMAKKLITVFLLLLTSAVLLCAGVSGD